MCAIVLMISIMLFSTICSAQDVQTDAQGEEEVVHNGELGGGARGKVLEIVSEDRQGIEGYSDGETMTFQMVKVLVKDGEYEGQELLIQNVLDDRLAYNINVDVGDEVMLVYDYDENGELMQAYISDLVRDKYLYWVIGLFVLLLVLIGGLKGIKSIVTLILTILAVLKVYLPLILKGEDPIKISILVCVGVIALTLTIVNGINIKSVAAILGTSLGVMVAGILTLVISKYAHLTGLGTQEAQMLTMIPQEIQFNFKGILFSAIILGALGAVMDVSMSIASSMAEIKEKRPDINGKALFKSGMNVGRDIMGTMSNTLILAYTGGSLHLMLLLKAYNYSLVEVLNRDMVASEVVRAMAGSIGLIFTIPITAAIFTLLMHKKENKNVRREVK